MHGCKYVSLQQVHGYVCRVYKQYMSYSCYFRVCSLVCSCVVCVGLPLFASICVHLSISLSLSVLIYL